MKHASSSASDVGTAVFGALDGLTSALGVLVGLQGRPSHVILLAAGGLAISSTVGMAAGQYCGDDTGTPFGRKVLRSGVMGLATAVGVLTPASPFLVTSGRPAEALMVLLAVLLAGVIAALRGRWSGLRRSFLETYVILALVSGLTIAMTTATGAG